MKTRAWLCLAALALAPACKQSPQEHIQGARNAVFEKRPDEALRSYRLALEALANDPSAEAQIYRARALRGAADVYYLELGDMRHAVETYRELIRVCPEAPESTEARIHLADILKAHFRDLRGAINELTAAVARNPPQSAELSYQVAKLYFELGDYQQCELEALGLAKKYETSSFVDDALFLRAQAVAMMEGRRAEAIRAFQELAERFPESDLQPHAQFEWGRLLSESGDSEKAIEIWVEALKRHPDPTVVQGFIAKVRRRVVATTPVGVGSRIKAFDRDKPKPVVPFEPKPSRPARTSVEAAGGTAAEAAAELGLSRKARGAFDTEASAKQP
jgi:tetratricopeptide (TPR) repeat protein